MSNVEKLNNLIQEAESIVFGQYKMLRSIVTAVICDGHLLIEGMPGLAKTLSISNDFGKRIQFISTTQRLQVGIGRLLVTTILKRWIWIIRTSRVRTA